MNKAEITAKAEELKNEIAKLERELSKQNTSLAFSKGIGFLGPIIALLRNDAGLDTIYLTGVFLFIFGVAGSIQYQKSIKKLEREIDEKRTESSELLVRLAREEN